MVLAAGHPDLSSPSISSSFQHPLPGSSTYCGVHDADAVCAYGVGDVPDVDGVEVFVVGCPLHEDLVVEVVQVLGHKDVDVAHDLQHIQALTKQAPANYMAMSTFSPVGTSPQMV